MREREKDGLNGERMGRDREVDYKLFQRMEDNLEP
jgi:hypothetical protein